ncbi:5'-adenylylsulfate reductase-like 5 [Nymphaea colorata]|nr:5'-adenylylsulfate reductase-like 5 [Nymphaea colorata]
MMKAKNLCVCRRGPSAAAFALVGFLLVSGFAGYPALAVSDPDVCPVQPAVDAVLSRRGCPLPFPVAPLQVDGDTLDELLTSGFMSEAYTSVLFYATWCPFSVNGKAAFDMLNSLFPCIRHLAVEESSALPSVFSRYGVHSLPAFLIVNQTTKVRYHGPKDIDSLIGFYKKITGTEAELCPTKENVGEEATIRLRHGSMWETLMRERYLALSVLFLCFRAFIYICPWLFCRMKVLWNIHGRRISLGRVFENRSPLLEQATHVLNVKRLWSKLRLSEMRKFQKGARSAKVWASSLASVSLGESSSSCTMRMEG